MSKPTKKTSRPKKAAGSRRGSKSVGKHQPRSHGDGLWGSFCDRFADLPFFQGEALYSIPERLIRLIDKHLDLFSPQEKEFELALSSEVGPGFAFEAQIPLNVVTRALAPGFTPKSEAWERMERNAQVISELSEKDLRSKNVSDAQIVALEAQRKSVSESVDESRVAYAGWLATNAEFRKELKGLQNKWQREIQKMRYFPHVEISLFGEKPWQIGKVDPNLNNDFMSFYRRWCIESLATWDLPIPLEVHLLDKAFYSFRGDQSPASSTNIGAEPEFFSLQKVDTFGFLVFIPWYLFRDKTVDVQELAAHQLLTYAPKHLDGWIEKRPRNWGLDRSLKMLQLFVYVELALKQRYGAKLKSAATKLDDVFASYFSGKEFSDRDKIKKIRLEMQQRLTADSGASKRGK